MPNQAHDTLAPKVGWVAPFQAATGMDHLGIQVIAEQIYTELLPGLTNVTDRLWNYAFYPWFSWAYREEGLDKDDQAFKDTLRRAEVLNTLVGVVHGLDHDSDDFVHGGGLVGRQKLIGAGKSLVSGEVFSFDEFAPQDAPRRYFANPRGGLGQYYLSVLRGLGIMQWDSKAGPQITDSRGLLLAEAMDAHVDRKAFFRVLKSEKLNLKNVRGLSSFCPCKLSEMNHLRKLFEGLLLNETTSPFHEVTGDGRRKTLQLILLSAAHFVPLKDSKDPANDAYWAFREAMYSGVWNNQKPAQAPVRFDLTKASWRAFQRHELFSVALQGLFWAGLSELSSTRGWIEDPVSYGRWFANHFSKALQGIGKVKEPIEQILRKLSSSLPPDTDIDNDDHEMRRAYAVWSSAASNDPQKTVHNALRVLLDLLARKPAGDPYEGFAFQEGYFKGYPINLRAFYDLDPHSMSLGDWVAWLAREWGINAHLRVAFRKLYGEHLDTFKVIPGEDRLRVVGSEEIPRPSWTSPRLNNAIRMLHDLGFLKRDLSISPRGKAFLAAEGLHG